jgi:porphobilinogen synthase
MGRRLQSLQASMPGAAGGELGKPVPTKWEFDNFMKSSPVLKHNRVDSPWVDQRQRPRRNRKSANIRGMVRENIVTPKDFIYPLFIHDYDSMEEISSMPGCFRHTMKSMMLEVEEAMKYGVGAFILFPKVPDNLKTNFAEEAYNPSGIVPRAISLIKSKYPEAVICTDIALDPYSSMGHDGVVHDGKILNDVTIMQLQKQAVMQARAGSDVVAPSDMMDGRIGAIRDALDSEGNYCSLLLATALSS